MFSGTMFETAKNWPQSKSPQAQEWINNNGIFKQPDTAVKMNQSLMLSEMLKENYCVCFHVFEVQKHAEHTMCLPRNLEGCSETWAGRGVCVGRGEAPPDSDQWFHRAGKQQSGGEGKGTPAVLKGPETEIFLVLHQSSRKHTFVFKLFFTPHAGLKSHFVHIFVLHFAYI